MKHATQGTLYARPKAIGMDSFLGTLGATLFIQACAILQAVLIARLLGPVGRGEYAAVILWPSLFAAVGLFGSSIALSRFAATKHDIAQIERTAVLLGILTSFVASGACYLAIPLLIPQKEGHLIDLARLFIVFIPLNHIASNLIAVDQGSGNFRRFNLTRMVVNPVYVGLVLLLWFADMSSLYSLTVALLIANLAVVLSRGFFSFSHSPIIGTLHSPKATLLHSVRFGLAGMLTPLYQHADKALLLWLLGSEDLGIYTVALSASAVIGSVTTAGGMVTFAMAAQAGEGKGFPLIANAFRMSALIWLILGSLLALVLPCVLPLVYGGEFSKAVTPARLLIIGAAFSGLSVQLEQAMQGQGKAFIGVFGRITGLTVMAILAIGVFRDSSLTKMCLAVIFAQFACLLTIVAFVNDHYKAHGMRPFFPGFGDLRDIATAIRVRTTFHRAH